MRANLQKFHLLANYKFVIAGGVIILLLLFFQWHELALGILAVIPLILLLRLSLLNGNFETQFLSMSYLGGQSICWLIGFLSCIYIFPLIDYPLTYLLTPMQGQPVKYTIVTMILVNLTMWGGVSGSQLALFFQKKQRDAASFSPLSGIGVRQGIAVTAIIFIVFLFVSYYGGIFSARTLIGRLPVGSILYWSTGLGGVVYLFFFFLGAYLRAPLFNRSNGILLLVLILCVFLLGLTGGRGTSIRMVLLFLGGSLYANISIKTVIHIVLGLVPVVLAFAIVIGAARGGNFITDPLEQRVEKVWHTVTVTIPEKWKNRTYYFLRRISHDLAGQVVIDSVVESQKFIGFRNFERLTTMFIPKFIIGEKLSADDGPERLRDDYGFSVTDFHSIPITFMADAFERGGYFATFLCSFLLSFWLTWVGMLLRRLKWPLLRAGLLITFAYHSFNIQAYSVLGTIREVTYSFAKDALLIGSVVFLISLLTIRKLKHQKL